MSFVTRELNDNEFVELRNHRGLEGRLVFDIRDLEIPDEVLDEIDEDLEVKSPSKRLRNVLYVYWKQKEIGGEFKDFYASKMESIIQKIRNTLD